MRAEIKQFIEGNILLLDTEQFSTFYSKVEEDIFADNVKGEITQVLWDAGIHPEKYLLDIPKSFAHTCKRVDTVDTMYEHIRSIGNFAFNNSNVTCVDLSKSSCLSIGYAAFGSCNHLTHVKLPANLECIEDSAFSHCYNLQSINIPAKVTELFDTFYNCKSLTDVTFEGTKQQFKDIKKSNMWRKGSGINEVVCLDGILRFK